MTGVLTGCNANPLISFSFSANTILADRRLQNKYTRSTKKIIQQNTIIFHIFTNFTVLRINFCTMFAWKIHFFRILPVLHYKSSANKFIMWIFSTIWKAYTCRNDECACLQNNIIGWFVNLPCITIGNRTLGNCGLHRIEIAFHFVAIEQDVKWSIFFI